jgi:hypothetical protein
MDFEEGVRIEKQLKLLNEKVDALLNLFIKTAAEPREIAAEPREIVPTVQPPRDVYSPQTKL